MKKKDLEVFKILKKINKKYYKAEKEFYDDTGSGDFRELPYYDKQTPQEIAKAIIGEFRENWIIVEKRTPNNPNYDYNNENLKKCPICNKVIDYHRDGFYRDAILNVWICGDHKLKEILEIVKLKDKDLIEYIKAKENGKQITFI